MILTNNGVAFPVADADFSVNNRRTLFDTNPVFDGSTQIPAVSAFPPLLGTANPQMRVQCPTLGFILPDMLINPLMADGWTALARIAFHAFSDLFRGMFLTEAGFNIIECLRRHFHRFTGRKAPL